jgi:hypothetical protein
MDTLLLWLHCFLLVVTVRTFHFLCAIASFKVSPSHFKFLVPFKMNVLEQKEKKTDLDCSIMN